MVGVLSPDTDEGDGDGTGIGGTIKDEPCVDDTPAAAAVEPAGEGWIDTRDGSNSDDDDGGGSGNMGVDALTREGNVFMMLGDVAAAAAVAVVAVPTVGDGKRGDDDNVRLGVVPARVHEGSGNVANVSMLGGTAPRHRP